MSENTSTSEESFDAAMQNKQVVGVRTTDSEKCSGDAFAMPKMREELETISQTHYNARREEDGGDTCDAERCTRDEHPNAKSRTTGTGAGDNAAECIPEARLKPQPGPFTPPTGKLTEIVFDLETSGLERTAEILQLSAICESAVFNQYLLPTKPIPSKVQEVNLLSFHNGVLRHNGQPVDAVSPEIGLKSFVEFVCSYVNPVLLGHNIQRFDCRVLFTTLERYPELFHRLNNHVVGYLDTLNMFKKERPGLKSYKQVDLVKVLTGKTYAAHDSLEDVRSLQSLMQHQAIKPEVKQRYTFTSDFIQESMDYRRQAKENLATLQDLITSGVISPYMAGKIADSGLQYSHLVLALKQKGVEGFKSFLAENNSLGEARVTTNRKIRDKIVQHFTTYKQYNEDDEDHLYLSAEP